MILVLFVYGLAFFILGLVIVVYPRKGSRFDLAGHIWLIGVFGIVHGVNEWLDMFIDIGRPLPPGFLAKVQMLTLGGSFFLLLQFGVAVAFRRVKSGTLPRGIALVPAVVWLAIVLFAESERRLLVGDIWARYLLCVPGAFLTAWALLSQVPDFRAMRLPSVTRNLIVAAGTFAVYGVLAGVFVKKASFFPATVVNYDSFIDLVFSDTCGGMLPGQSERAFDPVLISPQGPGGAALGLAVVKQIVTGHGGEITVETEAEGTTVFRVRLPAKRVY